MISHSINTEKEIQVPIWCHLRSVKAGETGVFFYCVCVNSTEGSRKQFLMVDHLNSRGNKNPSEDLQLGEEL